MNTNILGIARISWAINARERYEGSILSIIAKPVFLSLLQLLGLIDNSLPHSSLLN
jgi:hypothetical protein